MTDQQAKVVIMVDSRDAQGSGKRMTVSLPEPMYTELRQLSTTTGRSMTDILRAGLGLYQMAQNEQLLKVDDKGQPKHIVIL